jgi:shikimate dehydrogenase
MQRHEEAPKRFFLIGSHIEKSLSPAMHNAALKKLGIFGVYELHQIPEKEFHSEMKLIKNQPDLVGFNVTTPYKELVLPYISRMDSRSRVIGAVNTVKILSDGRMVGYNTDVDGILVSLKSLDVSVNSRAVILGAGGAARACAYALLKRGCVSLVILNRSSAHGLRLHRDFSRQFRTSEIRTATLNRKNVERELGNCDLLINAIANPFPIEIEFNKANIGMRFFDLWYGKPTSVLQRARKSHVKSIDGLLMLSEQAAKSLEIWTGKRAPRKTMYLAGKRALSRQAHVASA